MRLGPCRTLSSILEVFREFRSVPKYPNLRCGQNQTIKGHPMLREPTFEWEDNVPIERQQGAPWVG